MKDVLLQKKNLNIVVGHYRYSNVNKTRTASASVVIITDLFLLIFCFKFEKIFSSMVILSLGSIRILSNLRGGKRAIEVGLYEYSIA